MLPITPVVAEGETDPNRPIITQAVKAQMKERATERKREFSLPNGAEVKACGGGDQQMDEADA